MKVSLGDDRWAVCSCHLCVSNLLLLKIVRHIPRCKPGSRFATSSRNANRFDAHRRWHDFVPISVQMERDYHCLGPERAARLPPPAGPLSCLAVAVRTRWCSASTQRARGRRAICGFNICNNDPCFLKECRCRDLGSLSRTWACSHIARKRQIGAPRCKCSRRGNGRIGLGVIVPIKIRKRINRAEMFNAERPVSLPARPSRTRVVEWPWSSAMNATPPKPDVPLPYLSRLKFDVSREEGALPFQFVGHVGFS